MRRSKLLTAFTPRGNDARAVSDGFGVVVGVIALFAGKIR
jgi:hypothetical protein